VIDKDYKPAWRHDHVADVPPALVNALLAPLD